MRVLVRRHAGELYIHWRQFEIISFDCRNTFDNVSKIWRRTRIATMAESIVFRSSPTIWVKKIDFIRLSRSQAISNVQRTCYQFPKSLHSLPRLCSPSLLLQHALIVRMTARHWCSLPLTTDQLHRTHLKGTQNIEFTLSSKLLQNDFSEISHVFVHDWNELEDYRITEWWVKNFSMMLPFITWWIECISLIVMW